jgi:hypothetical protein
VAGIILSSAPGYAQTTAGSYEVRVGYRYALPVTFGELDANEVNASGGDFQLFESRTRLEAVSAIEAGLGVRVAPNVWLEASGSYGRSDLSVRLTSDVEGIPDTTATEPIRELTVEGLLRMRLARWQLGAHATPFVSAGGGYVRDLHDERALVESGGLAHVGIGLDVMAGATAGIRFDGRAMFRFGGLVFDDDVRTSPAVGASVYFRF